MTGKRFVWLAVFVVVLGTLAAVIPASPLYLPHFLNSGPQYQGRSLRTWIRALDGDDAAVRRRAIVAMGAMGAEAGEAVPALAKIMMEDPDREIRNEAALSLSKMDPASAAAMPQLCKAIQDRELFVRHNATRALRRLGTAARPAVPVLIEEVNNAENRTNLKTFTYTLQELMVLTLGCASAGTPDGLPALNKVLAAADTDSLRTAVARALGEIGPEARPAVDQLKKLLATPNAELREAAEEALRNIEGKS